MTLSFMQTYWIVGGFSIITMGVCVAGEALLKGAALSATAAMASMVALNVLSLIGLSMALALPVSLLYCLIKGRENPADLFKG